MTLQAILTAVFLPPLSLVLLGLAGALAGRRMVVILASASLLVLATPTAEGWLRAPLERAGVGPPLPDAAPEAIIVLGGDIARGRDGLDIGPLTLERLRAGAALHRATGLPLLVTAGPLGSGDVSLAELMAASLSADFGVSVRWIERRAGDTRDNAVLSAAMLRADGMASAYAVTHAWHLARAREAFQRAGLPVHPAPVRVSAVPRARPADWVPRADHLAGSWYVIREWAGRAAYALRDGR